ncbi:hypothetical protein SGQ83_19560 [Flavobacterium sp. Fl-318]|uniref:Pentapeptide repeat-containing protein n=1 Tax=Flavobacterium cupriresistens TaxID=2893885 RepID=A0ABU4RH13_9FLAO|nr:MULTISPECIES: hypothetical protein [unclassified Flavobacterium]MDX6191561.1 hypothetical protein [Flavobacterium sp. Fl-318]UFH43324.1 hypothetical protein LNP23_03690 [Flavobacterium sp. F-323]
MKNIDEFEFEKILYSKEHSISDCKIEFEKISNFDLGKIKPRFLFNNVVFSGKRFSFYKSIEKHSNYITFKNCLFLTDLYIGDCDFQNLHFVSNTFECQYIIIRNCKILDLRYSDENNFKNGNLNIDLSEIQNLDFENIIFSEFSKFKLTNSNFPGDVSIIRNNIDQLLVSHCIFKNRFDYFSNKFNHTRNSALFNNCEFNFSNFFESNFNNDTLFSNCKFLNITKIENTGDETKTTLKFDDCEFLKQVSFNKSRIHKIVFNNLKFHDIISLQETYFDIVDIDRTIFEKQAYFDDIEIKQIHNCNTRSIRTIKLQLQKAENKIDYNKFRIYEFNAYKKDIKKKLKEFKKDKDHLNHRVRQPIQLKRDLFILNISDVVSEYGTDWKRALKFTLLTGSIIYLLFFICENSNCKITLLNWDSYTRFTSGLFRFFLVTDFFNPLENDRTYLTNPLSWLIFIFGKIVIAFGIYEMIQSFRKFKA